jgi:hypothetical protein
MQSGFYYGYLNNNQSQEAAPYIHTLKLKKLDNLGSFDRGLKQVLLFLMPKDYTGTVFYKKGPIKINFESQRIRKKLSE